MKRIDIERKAISIINDIDEIGLDFSKDTYDGGLHLNLSGATKLSDYFGEILSKKYNLNDYSGDKAYDSLLEDYIKATK